MNLPFSAPALHLSGNTDTDMAAFSWLGGDEKSSAYQRIFTLIQDNHSRVFLM